MIEIRPARFADIPSLVRLAEEALAASRYAGFANLQTADVKATAAEAISRSSEGHAILFVADNGDRIEGCFLGTITPLYSTDVLVASNVFFYASASARKTTALRLLRTFMAWAEQVDGKLIYRFGMSDAVCNLEKLGRMMESAGFRLCGGTYERENL